MKAIVTMQMFNLPNYLKLDGPIGDSNGLDVGYLFPNDKEAGEFWDDCREKWIAHVKKRRDNLADVKREATSFGEVGSASAGPRTTAE